MAMPESKKAYEERLAGLVGRNGEKVPFKMPVFLPLNDNVVIRRNRPTEDTQSKLVLPDGVADQPLYGTVIAVGPGLFRGDCKDGQSERYPMSLKVGDTVIVPALPETLLDAKNQDSGVVICTERAVPVVIGDAETAK